MLPNFGQLALGCLARAKEGDGMTEQSTLADVLIAQVYEFTGRWISNSEAEKLIGSVKQAHYVRLADAQSLPGNPYLGGHKAWEYDGYLGYKAGQQDMVAAEFRKVEL